MLRSESAFSGIVAIDNDIASSLSKFIDNESVLRMRENSRQLEDAVVAAAQCYQRRCLNNRPVFFLNKSTNIIVRPVFFKATLVEELLDKP